MARKKKPKLGRPPVAAADKRHPRTFKATDEEWATFLTVAKKAGKTRSEWIRCRLRKAAGLPAEPCAWNPRA